MPCNQLESNLVQERIEESEGSDEREVSRLGITERIHLESLFTVYVNGFCVFVIQAKSEEEAKNLYLCRKNYWSERETERLKNKIEDTDAWKIELIGFSDVKRPDPYIL